MNSTHRSTSEHTAHTGQSAQNELGWWRSHRLLILRRLSQLSVLSLFATGPLFGLWLFKGNLSSSILLDTIPLSDPLATMQVLMSGHWPELSLLLGAIIVVGIYALLGGRVFCSWVCPVNIITDLASWIRRALSLPRTSEIAQNWRYYMLILVLILPILTGLAVWEWVNPVPIVYRALLFSASGGLWLLAVIFLLDTFVVERAWCSHLCPTGALFSLVGKMSPIKIAAVRANACNNCMDCFTVCPERQVLKPVLKKGSTQPLILDSDCTLCGRCIDVCAPRVFQYENRFNSKYSNRIPLKVESQL
ncbi:quinol dehydrogenase ferredoxin subunit NapH [Shewanella sp.]|uniref:quinol dehydrogenase ferredoxin subunit NapH n=2 Tax=Shewanella sp. TaxID=50422 RepID=UPI0040478E28